MACQSIDPYFLVCGNESVIGGNDKLYLIAFSELTNVEGSIRPYSLASNDVINEIAISTGKNFVEVGVGKNVISPKMDGVFNENGTSYKTIELSFSILDFSAEAQGWVENAISQPVAAIVRSKTGKFYALGLQSGIKASAMNGTTGVADADLNGFTLTFTGADTLGMKLIDSDIAQGALVPAA